jgi:phenylalanyl-tRNA synthetase beta subunit
MAVMPNKIFYYGTLVRNILVGRGFSEAYNYSFAEKGEIELQNPLSSEYKFLRSDFISALKENLKQATYNAPLLGLEDIRIFEIGKIFEKSGPGPGPGRRSGERWELGLAVKNIFGKSKDKSATILAEAMQSIGEELDLDLKPFIKVPGLKGAKDEEMALIEFERLVAELPEPKGYDGLNLEKSEPVKYKKISAFPFVLRDVAVWVPDGVESEEVSKIIIANAGELLALDPKLFDQFNKNSRTSYAFHLVFQSYEKTLSDEEVGGPMKKIAKTFIDRGWEMR